MKELSLIISFLQLIGIDAFRHLFRAGLDPDIMIEIIETLQEEGKMDTYPNVNFAVDMLSEISKVPRFTLGVAFFTSDQKAALDHFLLSILSSWVDRISEKEALLLDKNVKHLRHSFGLSDKFYS